MLIFENNKTLAKLYQRALSLYISKEFANKAFGQVNQTPKQHSEQTFSRRELLAVEEQAKQEKIIAEHGEKYFRDQVMSAFFSKLTTEVMAEFDQKESFYRHFLNLEDAAPTILEILSLPSASVNRITPLIKLLPWLASDLINLVNKPQYRKRADVKVSDPNLAISYVGLDNLKLIVPTFILKHTLPITTDPYPLMKRKLWNDSLSVALAAKVLAEHKKLDWYSAFAAAILSNIGYLTVITCFLSKYNEMHNAALRQAYESRDKRLHDLLVQAEISPELLLKMMTEHSSKVGADLIELMRFDRLEVTEPVFDLAYGSDLQKMSPVAQVVAKARTYVAYRSLAREDLIDKKEAKALLTAVDFSPKEIALLKKSDIDHIKLNFN
ncbi:HDOD domain-containing protein [Thalassomonas haliotis]|uniref:HDOD domain-containing protein n=1 Tax=Thalassomonas haliotis TaxID=485448 RepID=A0ABY7VD06_9GAMM|nr:HDOD domain-containing protein [Thalassomonas haliotis]WDE11489.1 HDOD domain-containing protein [Thalassomonas haliotis]